MLTFLVHHLPQGGQLPIPPGSPAAQGRGTRDPPCGESRAPWGLRAGCPFLFSFFSLAPTFPPSRFHSSQPPLSPDAGERCYFTTLFTSGLPSWRISMRGTRLYTLLLLVPARNASDLIVTRCRGTTWNFFRIFAVWRRSRWTNRWNLEARKGRGGRRGRSGEVE